LVLEPAFDAAAVGGIGVLAEHGALEDPVRVLPEAAGDRTRLDQDHPDPGPAELLAQRA